MDIIKALAQFTFSLVVFSSYAYGDREINLWINKFSDDRVNVLLLDVISGDLSREEIYLDIQVDCGFMTIRDKELWAVKLGDWYKALRPSINVLHHNDISPCFSFGLSGQKFYLHKYHDKSWKIFQYPSEIIRYLLFQIDLYELPFKSADFKTVGYYYRENCYIRYGQEPRYSFNDDYIILKSCQINPFIRVYPELRKTIIERTEEYNIKDETYKRTIVYSDEELNFYILKYLDHIDKNSFLDLSREIKKFNK